MLRELLDEIAPGTAIHDIDATDPGVAQQYRHPGSPTVRIDRREVDPVIPRPRRLHTAMSSLLAGRMVAGTT
jgi:hypothetical protein